MLSGRVEFFHFDKIESSWICTSSSGGCSIELDFEMIMRYKIMKILSHSPCCWMILNEKRLFNPQHCPSTGSKEIFNWIAGHVNLYDKEKSGCLNGLNKLKH